jgi:hypothetical protein
MNHDDDTLALTTFIRERLVPAELKDTFDETSLLLEWGVLEVVHGGTYQLHPARAGREVPATPSILRTSDVRSVAAMVRRSPSHPAERDDRGPARRATTGSGKHVY